MGAFTGALRDWPPPLPAERPAAGWSTDSAQGCHPARMLRQRRRARWEETLTLDDGRVLWLRPIQPADAEPLRATFGLLTPDEVRMRFLHPLTELTPEMARRFTALDPQHEFALVLAEPYPPGEALVGAVVRASVEPQGEAAEFALIVSHFIGRQGLGRLLMHKLFDWARWRGIRRLYGDVLVENTAMLAMCRSLGFQREAGSEPGIVRVVLDVSKTRRRRITQPRA
jgi:RimJ/RimL family protein N-acetyltransferase